MSVGVDLEQDLGVDFLDEEPRRCLGVQLDRPVGEGRCESFGGPGDGRVGAGDVVGADVAIEDLVSERDLDAGGELWTPSARLGRGTFRW